MASTELFEVGPVDIEPRVSAYQRMKETATKVSEIDNWVAIAEFDSYNYAHAKASKIRDGQFASFRSVGQFDARVDPHGESWRLKVKFIQDTKEGEK